MEGLAGIEMVTWISDRLWTDIGRSIEDFGGPGLRLSMSSGWLAKVNPVVRSTLGCGSSRVREVKQRTDASQRQEGYSMQERSKYRSR